MTLVCFPFGGGSASAYRHWQKALPASVELIAIEPPGRGSRWREPPLTSLESYVEGVLPELAPLLTRPVVFFGHSMGALIAFELTRTLHRRGLALPRRLVVSGRRPPHLPPRGKVLHMLPDEALMEELRRLNGTPEELLNNAGLMSLVLPAIRGDCQICECYEYSPGPPLPLALDALGGSDDEDLPPSELDAWSLHGAAEFEARVFAGDHFFIQQSEQALIEWLVARLTQSGSAGAGRNPGG